MNVNGELRPEAPFGSSATHYIEAGWAPFPLPVKQKSPPWSGATGWRGQDLSPSQVEDVMRGHRTGNIGLRMPSGVIGIDVDDYEGKSGGETLGSLEAELGPLPTTYILTSRKGPEDRVSGIRFFRVQGDVVLDGVMGPGIEVIQRHHRYACAAPSIHPKTGLPYIWLNSDRSEAPAIPLVADLPYLPDPWVDRFKAKPRQAGGPIANSGMVSVWLDVHDTHVACGRITAVIEEFEKAEGARHDAMLSAQLSVVNLGAMGHEGATHGLEELRQCFLDRIGNDRQAEGEWFTALAGAIGIIHDSPPKRTGCCPTPSGKPPLQNPHNPADAPDYFLDRLVDCPPLFGTFRWGATFAWTPRLGEEGYIEPPDKEDGDDNGPATIAPLDDKGITAFVNARVWLYDETLKNGRIVRTRTFGSGQGWSILIRRAIHHYSIPKLAGVTHTPCLRPDGTILDTPGYDALSGLAYMPLQGLVVPEIPAMPTRTDIETAVGFLLDLIAEFPWASVADRNNYLAMWLTPLVLPLLREPGPMGIINAPMMGSGKSLLSKVLANTHGAVLRGRFLSEGEEIRKQITTLLTQTTAPVVIWDNVDGVIGSADLASLTTKNVWTDRALGSNTELSVPSKRLFVLNGNNVSLGGDMARRGLWATIDPGRPRPWDRTGFKYDNLDTFVAINRGRVLAALLTLVRAWVAAGMPRQRSRSDSFKEWFEVMTGILQTVGVEGGVGSTERDQNTEGEEDGELGELLTALWDLFGEAPFLAGTAAEACEGKGGGFSDLGRALPMDLHDRFIALGYQGKALAKSLGRYLLRNEGRWASGKCVRRDVVKVNYKDKPAWRVDSSSAVTPFPPSVPVAVGVGVGHRLEEGISSSSPVNGRNRTAERAERAEPREGTALAFDFETCSADRLWSEEPWPGFCRLLAMSDASGETWTTSDPEVMRKWLTGAALLVGHNALGFDVPAAARHLGLDFEELSAKTIDTLVWARLVEPPQAMVDEFGRRNANRLSYRLDDVAQRRCGIGKEGDIKKLANKHNRTAKFKDRFEAIPTNDPEYIEYVRQDARCAWAVYADQCESITNTEYAQREMALARLAAAMTWRGFEVDLDGLKKRVEEDDTEVDRLLGILREHLGPINKRLGKEAKDRLGELLTDAGVKVVRTKDGHVGVGSGAMTPLAEREDLIGDLARGILALNGQRGLPIQVSNHLGTDGRIHASIDMCSQASGRWSVTKPGLTTFGKRSESLLRDRDLFIASEGHVLYARDLSQIDVRGMAALSQDKRMIERLQPGLDWHAQVAEVVWGDPLRRNDAKPLAHAINYNAGPGTVSKTSGLSWDEADKVIMTLNTAFPDLAAFKRTIVASAKAGNEVTNGWGRVLNVAVNRSFTQAPGLSGQGWARDAVMECLLRMEERGVARYVIAHIHDEFVFEIPEDDMDEVVPLIAEAMTFERDGVPVISEGSKLERFWGDLYRKA